MCREGGVSRCRPLMSILAALLLVGAVWGAKADVGVGEGEEWREVGVANPCDHYRCEPGDKCVPIVNDLLQLPVAHCVENTASDRREDSCTTYELGVSIVTCKSEIQWRDTAASRCGLTREQPTVKVRHPCHRRNSSSPAIFLQATISCCPVQSETPPISTVTTPTTESDNVVPLSPGYDQISEEQDGEGEGGEGEEEGEGEGEGKSGVSLVVPLALGGCLLILIATIGTIKLLHCRKRRPAAYKPRLEFVTAYVNPSSEGWEEGEGRGYEKADLSLLITNSNTG